MEINNYSFIAKRTAQLSFGIGTGILISYLLTDIESIQIIGLLYLIIATLVNSIILFITVIRILIIEKDRFEIFKNALLILVNIPIAYLYSQLVLN